MTTFPHFAAPGEALRIYTDGSSSAGKQDTVKAEGFGWVLANPTANLTPARVVSRSREFGKNTATQMESAAIVNALNEFLFYSRPLEIFTDTQSLPNLLKAYLAGEVGSEVFYNTGVLREEDTVTLMRLIPRIREVGVTFTWVKGHSNCFPNMVCDQMLRMAVLKSIPERDAYDFAVEAMQCGKAKVWHKRSYWDQDLKERVYESAMVTVRWNQAA